MSLVTRRYWSSSWLLLAGVSASLASAALVACGDEPQSVGDSGFGSGLDAAVDPDGGDPFNNGTKSLMSVSVDPPAASVEILNGAVVTSLFSAVGHYSDGSTKVIATDVGWTADLPPVGNVDPTGLYTPTAKVGGLVTVTANHKGMKATAALTVKLHDQQNPSNTPGSVQSKLKAAGVPDANGVWSYPFNKTVFPRGLGSATLMWKGSLKDDVFYIHISSPY